MLVEYDRILLVLDGFDEFAPEMRQAALDAFNTTTLPLLMTGRSDEYAAVAGAGALTAAVAGLTNLTVSDLVYYLPRTTRGSRRCDRVGSNPERVA